MLINGKQYGIKSFRLVRDGKTFEARIPRTMSFDECLWEISTMNKARKRYKGVYVTMVTIVDGGEVVGYGVSVCSRTEPEVSHKFGQRKALERALENMGVSKEIQMEILVYLDEKAETSRRLAREGKAQK